jgi:hypothetical protein
MAEEVEMTPVAPEPPKADPLAKPAAPLGGSTLKLNPVARPTAGAASKTGATVNALRPGLKLPSKPGATVNALRPGLKLPPKPGATANALKPGLKLPPKPVIHKPGEAIAAAPLPKPVAPVASATSEPAAPEAAKPAAEVPAASAVPVVEGQAITREDTPAPAPTAAPLEQLKAVTQKLKGVTQPIPQQAILRKTGIIAEDATTEAQKEASKHKTARISLSDAMGVAPVKDEHAPMKTIRIKRPIDIASLTTGSTAPVPRPASTSATPAATPAETAAAEKAESAATPAPATSVTQRKTLRISRPGGAVRPSGKFGLKHPSQTSAPTKPAVAPIEGAAAPAEGGMVADVADIPEMPMAAPAAAAKASSDGPAWLWVLSTLVQAAACAAIGALAWFLYQNTQTQYF